LHHLIYVEGIREERYHTDYAISLIDSVLKILPSDSTRSDLKMMAGTEGGVLGEYRARLLSHLRDSSLYDKAAVLERLRDSLLYEELVQVYRCIGNHEEALKVIIFKLQDYKQAERYCEDVFEADKAKAEALLAAEGRRRTSGTTADDSDGASVADDQNPLFLTYVKVCLSSEGFNKNLDAVRELLNNRASEMDPVRILNVLSDDIPAIELEQFLAEAIKFSSHRLKSNKIKHKIAETQNIDVRRRHKKATNRHLLVTSNTPCSVCSQPIGNSVFSIFPNMTIVHYKCMISVPSSSGSVSTPSPGAPKKDAAPREKDRHLHPKTKINYNVMPVDL
jgi:Vacuolar sorting protein 39 domain 2/Region in Clathrin and VPS